MFTQCHHHYSRITYKHCLTHNLSSNKFLSGTFHTLFLSPYPELSEATKYMWARGSLVVKKLGYKPEGRRFETR
jgi:hypothetical protein